MDINFFVFDCFITIFRGLIRKNKANGEHVSTHRNWGDVRKLLEQDLLCEALKGRIRYFATRYRHAHDGYGRVCILVGDKEILNIPFPNEDKVYSEVHRRKKSRSNERNANIYREVRKKFHDDGKFDPNDFGLVLDEYLSPKIEVSLLSENWFVRLFAILDRRVGKRSLVKLQTDATKIPEWLEYFYYLHFKSEGII